MSWTSDLAMTATLYRTRWWTESCRWERDAGANRRRMAERWLAGVWKRKLSVQIWQRFGWNERSLGSSAVADSLGLPAGRAGIRILVGCEDFHNPTPPPGILSKECGIA